MPRAKMQDRKVLIKCPGCGWHLLPITPGQSPVWGFNGNFERPTFTPSILAKSGHYVSPERGGRAEADCFICKEAKAEGHETACVICHSFVVDGRIQFLSDSTHKLAGQTVDLPEVG